MKNKLHISILLFAILEINVSAQITITSADMPQVGDAYVRATDNSPNVTPGNAGANQVWNFSSLQNNGIDSEQFINPSSAPLSSDFSSATIAYKVSNGGGGFEFCKTTSDSFNFLGSVSYPSLTEFFYSPTFEELPIPCTYQTKWGGFTNMSSKTSTILYPGYDSILDISHQVYNDTMDGWGSLITPLGTFNAIRAYEISNNTDSIWRHSTSSQSWIYYQSSVSIGRVFIWRTNSVHERIVRMYVNSSFIPTSVIWIQSIIPAGIQEQESSSQQIFPNPARDELFFKTNSQKINAVRIFDICGNEIETIQVTSDLVNLNIAEFPSGIYFYELIGEPSEIIGRGKFVVQK